jgi:hypothetical protein
MVLIDGFSKLNVKTRAWVSSVSSGYREVLTSVSQVASAVTLSAKNGK